jgi:hypothetical protein
VIETTYIDHNGMRVGVPLGNEMRGNDAIYDPWLRIPKIEVNQASDMLKTAYLAGNYRKVIDVINHGGINHINRIFFNSVLQTLSPAQYEKLLNLIEEKGSNKAKILFYQIYGHRLYDAKQKEKAFEFIKKSIVITKTIPHPSWDKWVASGNFFLARYSSLFEKKTKYCILTITEPRDIITFSAWMKYWKLFRAAAWLVGNDVSTPAALKAVKRFKDLNYEGYCEVNPGGRYEWAIGCTLDDPKQCRLIMKPFTTHEWGDP